MGSSTALNVESLARTLSSGYSCLASLQTNNIWSPRSSFSCPLGSSFVLSSGNGSSSSTCSLFCNTDAGWPFAFGKRLLGTFHIRKRLAIHKGMSTEGLAFLNSSMRKPLCNKQNSRADQESFEHVVVGFKFRGADTRKLTLSLQRCNASESGVGRCKGGMIGTGSVKNSGPQLRSIEATNADEARTLWTFIVRSLEAAVVVGCLSIGISSAEATDALKTCACLLKECRLELARCIADPGCAANVACLQTCNNRPDETECQIACGDLFENKVVDQFNDCAVSKKGCVPQKRDDGQFPIPAAAALVQNFSTLDFTGKWYISSGLNKTFDTFDCQLHEFSATSGKLTGHLSWRIATPDGGFFTRSAVQNFMQDSTQPGVLYNHGNEFLHYQDDWYILSAKTEKKPDDYIFVYYRGKNDAWDGYGGAIVYTRSRILPSSIVPELKAAAMKVGLNFADFKVTDNTCGPEPPLFARLEKKVEEGEQVLAREVREIGETVRAVGKKELGFLSKEAQLLQREEEEFLKSLGKEEKELLDSLQMEAMDIERLFGKALPIRKLK